MDDFVERLHAYFQHHEEQAFLLKTVLLIGGILLLRGVIDNLITVWLLMLLFAPVYFYLYARVLAAFEDRSTWSVMRDSLSFMPVIYAEGEWRKEGVGWLTCGLILLDVLVYYLFQSRHPELVRDSLVFLPFEPDAWNIPLSLFTSIFLHGSQGHLWGNMLFLWAIGSVIERRIGWRQTLLLYLLCGVVGNLAGVTVLYVFTGKVMHCLGASGAIAGLMGIFSVRCYFKTMIFPLPVLGLLSLVLPLGLKVKLNALTVIGLFFLVDLSRGLDQVSGVGFSQTAHWVHIGGMLAGVVAGFWLNLQADAVAERHLEIGLDTSERAILSHEQRERALRTGLDRNPENVDALLKLARLKAQYEPTNEGYVLYHKVLRNLAERDPRRATETFLEFLRYYKRVADPSLHYRLAGLLRQQGDRPHAASTLRMLATESDVPESWAERALYAEARVLQEMGESEAAENTLRIFAERFPESAMISKVHAALAGQ